MQCSERLVNQFLTRFPGPAPQFQIRAPGRVNLIGEHVDYNDGLVLPVAIDQCIRIAARVNGDGMLRGFSSATNEGVEIAIDDIGPAGGADLRSFVSATATELQQAGFMLKGCDFVVNGDLPLGAGLSSSAALEIGLALTLLTAAGNSLPMAEIARLARRVEHRTTGVPCGIMDQFASALSRAQHALLIDCRNETIEHVPWPDGYSLLIIDSGIRRELASGAYHERVRECAEARLALGGDGEGPVSLRDVTLEALEAARLRMPDAQFRRARHVISEIERTQHAVRALRRGDVQQLGRLMNESHESLRGDYEVSLAQIDEIAQLVRSVPGVAGARLTGAGFGGCVVALALHAAVPIVRQRLHSAATSAALAKCRLLETSPAAGAEVSARV